MKNNVIYISNAHAWVEIYQEGKGWMIVDPTPA
ncbi:MAG: transglutaminase domain-containing protein, partial [Bacilli bacterium]|nr:transglutaminase domain-containing protein [Bacilli bacterium]